MCAPGMYASPLRSTRGLVTKLHNENKSIETARNSYLRSGRTWVMVRVKPYFENLTELNSTNKRVRIAHDVTRDVTWGSTLIIRFSLRSPCLHDSKWINILDVAILKRYSLMRKIKFEKQFCLHYYNVNRRRYCNLDPKLVRSH